MDGWKVVNYVNNLINLFYCEFEINFPMLKAADSIIFSHRHDFLEICSRIDWISRFEFGWEKYFIKFLKFLINYQNLNRLRNLLFISLKFWKRDSTKSLQTERNLKKSNYCSNVKLRTFWIWFLNFWFIQC